MNRLLSLILFAGMTAGLAAGEDIVFRKSKILDSKEKERKVDLVFLETDRAIVVRQKKSVLAQIPFDAIEKVEYGTSKHHRIDEGFPTHPILLIPGVIVMLTKGTKHWLYIDYKDPEGVGAELVLRLDKSEFQKILVTVKSQTGRDVELLPEEGMNRPGFAGGSNR